MEILLFFERQKRIRKHFFLSGNIKNVQSLNVQVSNFLKPRERFNLIDSGFNHVKRL
jgi:hypothetical protein